MTSMGWEDDGAQEGLMLRRSVGKCLTEAEIEDFLSNRLSGVTREVIEEHLLVCSKCLDAVEQEEEFANAFRAAAVRLESEDLEKSYVSEAPPPPDPGTPAKPAGGLVRRLLETVRKSWKTLGLLLAWVFLVVRSR
ncbi:zf-HC2 domain-containing protein [uncultured Paludibaculum sp.]|uniref:zf-HC2 domain-containing protein n=1 Tax=uncultured Paludibaculum sp. TaxID=1765020 RepID=UPI002AAA9287|nr:zf-HC2 domain-containing protein [uncultured Paludibaculum sp.]